MADVAILGRTHYRADQTEGTLCLREFTSCSRAAMRKKYWVYWPASEVMRILLAVGLAKDNAGSFEVTIR